MMNVAWVAKTCKKRLFLSFSLKALLLLAFACVFVCLVVYSIFPVIFFGSLITLVTVMALRKLVDIKIPACYTFGTVKGRIVKIHIDKKNVRETKIGGVGFGNRRGDHDRRDITVCDLFVEESRGKITSIRFEDVSEKHCDYYRAGDEVMLPVGARFPVLLIRTSEEWICPVCGEFNSDEMFCKKCSLKIVE